MISVMAIGKVNIVVDLDSIIAEAKNWQYDEDSYDGRGEVDTCASYAVSEEEFNASKDDFIKKLEEFKKDEPKLIEYIKNSLNTNKNGSLSKNRRNLVLKFGPVRDYNNSYGSHSYTVDALMVIREDNFEGKLCLSSYKEQSSF